MLHEVKLIEIDADDVVKEADDFHQKNFATFDILDDDVRLAEPSGPDQVSHAKTLRSATRSLCDTFKFEIRRLRDRNAFA